MFVRWCFVPLCVGVLRVCVVVVVVVVAGAVVSAGFFARTRRVGIDATVVVVVALLSLLFFIFLVTRKGRRRRRHYRHKFPLNVTDEDANVDKVIEMNVDVPDEAIVDAPINIDGHPAGLRCSTGPLDPATRRRCPSGRGYPVEIFPERGTTPPFRGTAARSRYRCARRCFFARSGYRCARRCFFCSIVVSMGLSMGLSMRSSMLFSLNQGIDALVDAFLLHRSIDALVDAFFSRSGYRCARRCLFSFPFCRSMLSSRSTSIFCFPFSRYCFRFLFLLIDALVDTLSLLFLSPTCLSTPLSMRLLLLFRLSTRLSMRFRSLFRFPSHRSLLLDRGIDMATITTTITKRDRSTGKNRTE